MTKFYLAYGSNLNIRQMRFRCSDAQPIGTAEISDYQLLFKGSKTGAYLTIEKKKGGIVPVAVWAVSERDEERLDVYEGCPNFYYKTQMTLPVQNLETGKNCNLNRLCVHHARGAKFWHSTLRLCANLR